MIATLGLENFRAFQKKDIALRPITVILGPNNSGKSSLIAPLRLLVQTVDSFDFRVPLLLDGPLGDFGTYRDVVYGNDRRRRIRLVLGIRTRRDRRRRPPTRPTRGTYQWRELEAPEWQLGVKFWYRTQRRELTIDEVELTKDGVHYLTIALSKDASRHFVTRVRGKELTPSVRSRIPPDAAILQHFVPRVHPYAFRETRQRSAGSGSRAREGLQEAYEIAHEFVDALRRLEYVGPMRLPPARIYQASGETHSRVGAQGENWAGLLALNTPASGSRSRTLDADIDSFLQQAHLASDIRIDWISDRHYELRVQHPVSGEYENLADVGQGNSQVLPVLVGGFRTPTGATFMVEEPEIHLHPHAQAELGDFFLTLYERGVQSLIETHSEYLILRLQQHVASGDIPSDHIVFLYVHATKDEKEVAVLELDADAVFQNPIPGGFFPQKLEEAKKLARIRAE